MSVVVLAVELELAEILRSGLAHPYVGGLLDAGSYGRVIDVSWGSAGLTELVGPECDRALRASGVDPIRVRSLGGPDTRTRPALVIAEWPLHQGGAVPDDGMWHEVVGAGDTLALVVADTANALAPLWILTGDTLPVMGPVEPCRRADLWNTWCALAGGVRGSARFLLEEPDAPGDPLVEQALTARLRELYGE
jgi:hypothetical protein